MAQTLPEALKMTRLPVVLDPEVDVDAWSSMAKASACTFPTGQYGSVMVVCLECSTKGSLPCAKRRRSISSTLASGAESCVPLYESAILWRSR